MEQLTGAQAVKEAIATLMRRDPKSITYGLGINDPGRVFGTTSNLLEEFGVERVFETPTSELALTGVGVGLAIAGHRAIYSHQRMDFALLGMDQLVNSAAKWKFMFGDQVTVPLLVRMIIGRGWGQGPTHSQNFESWLAHTPGLRVLVPATPQDLADAILALETTEEPIVVIEHRWTHGISGSVDSSAGSHKFLPPITHSQRSKPDITIATWGLATFECLAAQALLRKHEVVAEVVQIRELSLESIDQLEVSVRSSRNLVVAANSWGPASFPDSILAFFQSNEFKGGPIKASRVHYPHKPESSSLRQLGGFHVSDSRIANSAFELLGLESRIQAKAAADQPSGETTGPF